MTVVARDDARLSRRPDIVLFDLDNTIYPYQPAHEAGLDAAVEQLRLEYTVSADELRRRYSDARAAIKKRLGTIAAAHSRLLYFHTLLESLGIGSQAEMALRLEQIYWGNFLAAMRPDDGALQLLSYFRSAGVGLGLITDLTAQIQFRKLVLLQLHHAFDWIVASEEAGGNKITGLPYRLAREKAGWTDSDVVWMIGDSHVDIDPARDEIDALTLLYTGNGPPEQTCDPNVTFTNFADLLSAIESDGLRRSEQQPSVAAR